MFGLASGIYQSYFAPPKLSILIVGVDGAGKTSLLERVKVTKVDTKLDIGSSSTSSLSPQPSRGSQLESLIARYAKGAVAMTSAVVGEGGGTSAEGDGNDHAEGAKASVKKSGYLNNVVGGTPARLPPPLPPRKAAKSRQWVEEIIKISSGETTTTTSENATGESNATTKTKVTGKDILDMVPPPPLFGDDMERPSNAATTETRLTATKSTNPQPKKPPLPSKATTAAANKLARTNTPISPSKTSTFIQFLRCPSPQSYSSAALGEEDEYDGDVESSSFAPTVSTTASKEPASAMEEENDDDDNTDSIDHLRNYYINFQENEQFDMNTYNNLKRNNPVKMFPLDKIRPTLGQNLAKLDMSGCKCSLFDLSGSVGPTTVLLFLRIPSIILFHF